MVFFIAYLLSRIIRKVQLFLRPFWVHWFEKVCNFFEFKKWLGFLSFSSPLALFLLKFSWMQCKEDMSTMLTWLGFQGCDNSPQLKRIPSQDLEVVRNNAGYSSRRRSSLSQVASFSEWFDHWTLRNLRFQRRVVRTAWSRIHTGYSRYERLSWRSSVSWSTSRIGSEKQCQIGRASCRERV